MMADIIPLNAWKGQLQQGERGVKRNLTNLMLHLRNLDGLGKDLRFNEQTQYPEWRGERLEEHHFVDIRLIVERAGYAPQAQDVRPAILRVCLDNSYNPIADYLTGLVWDGTPRLDRWMVKLLGSPDTPFVRAVSAKALIAAVARIMQPGCQVDTMLVLEGPQGVRKSTAVQVLFGRDNAFEVVSGFDDHRKLAVNMMGAWAVELAEFVAVTRSHAGSVKGLISMRTDRVLLPYGRALTDLPRRAVFIGTINPGAGGYLTDDTGNRRYWPVPVTRVDIDGLAARRDQLWAEAMALYRQGVKWWLEGDELDLAEEVQAEREEDEPWVAILEAKTTGRSALTTDEAMALLGIEYERRSRAYQMRAGTALRRLGYERVKARAGPDRKPRWEWKRP